MTFGSFLKSFLTLLIEGAKESYEKAEKRKKRALEEYGSLDNESTKDVYSRYKNTNSLDEKYVASRILKKRKEERSKLEQEIKDEIKKEMNDEKERKKRELLKKKIRKEMENK